MRRVTVTGAASDPQIGLATQLAYDRAMEKLDGERGHIAITGTEIDTMYQVSSNRPISFHVELTLEAEER